MVLFAQKFWYRATTTWHKACFAQCGILHSLAVESFTKITLKMGAERADAATAAATPDSVAQTTSAAHLPNHPHAARQSLARSAAETWLNAVRIGVLVTLMPLLLPALLLRWLGSGAVSVGLNLALAPLTLGWRMVMLGERRCFTCSVTELHQVCG